MSSMVAGNYRAGARCTRLVHGIRKRPCLVRLRRLEFPAAAEIVWHRNCSNAVPHHYTNSARRPPMATTTPDDVLKLIKDKEVKFVDLRFTDTRGKEQHVTVPVKYFGKDKFEQGHAFDGSSIAGWKGIQASDMLLMPDAVSARMDPFTDEPVLNLSCDVI